MTNPWYISYDNYLMSWIYLYLACYLTHVGTWLNQISWDCNLLISWAISTSPSLYTRWLKTRKHETIQTYPLTNLLLRFMIVILDTQVLFLARLTHVGRWTQIPSGAPNSWWATSTLSNPHKFNYIKTNTTTQGMLFHLREALLRDMS